MGAGTVLDVCIYESAILKYCNESEVQSYVHGAKGHSYYFGKDAYEKYDQGTKYTSNKGC